ARIGGPGLTETKVVGGGPTPPGARPLVTTKTAAKPKLPTTDTEEEPEEDDADILGSMAGPGVQRTDPLFGADPGFDALQRLLRGEELSEEEFERLKRGRP
ncbi:MAG: hypothetical protein L0206_20340, partial [Actinobacteria bacterium]|nr:hypothetical protein [Actinomycetota bacterium]